MEPTLIEPVKIKIESINKTDTVFSGPRREPGNVIVRNAQFEIDSQIKYFSQNDPTAEQLGVDEDATGYVLVKISDLLALGKTINRGDKIVQLADVVVEFFVTKNMPCCQDSGGKFTMTKYFFMDREP